MVLAIGRLLCFFAAANRLTNKILHSEKNITKIASNSRVKVFEVARALTGR
jgi:hypothetical protein